MPARRRKRRVGKQRSGSARAGASARTAHGTRLPCRALWSGRLWGRDQGEFERPANGVEARTNRSRPSVRLRRREVVGREDMERMLRAERRQSQPCRAVGCGPALTEQPAGREVWHETRMYPLDPECTDAKARSKLLQKRKNEKAATNPAGFCAEFSGGENWQAEQKAYWRQAVVRVAFAKLYAKHCVTRQSLDGHITLDLHTLTGVLNAQW